MTSPHGKGLQEQHYFSVCPSVFQLCYLLPNHLVEFNQTCCIHYFLSRGWLGEAKVWCTLCHRGVQLMLAYCWPRTAILAAGMGRGGILLYLLFLYFHSFSSLASVPFFHLLHYLFYLSSPFVWEMTQNNPQGLTCG